MTWKFWKWFRKEQPKPENPIISIEGLMDGNFFVRTSWPTPKDEKHEAAIAREIANLMFVLSSGDFAGSLYQSVAVAGHQSEQDKLAEAAINMCQRAMDNKFGNGQDDDLVVPPEEAFRA